MTQQQKQQAIAGIALVVLGLALYYLEGLGYTAVFFLVGGSFLAGYLYGRDFGLLVPGCIVLGLGFGSIGESLFSSGGPKLVGLGAGFVGITAIRLIYERKLTWWPLIPGAVLLLLGTPKTKRVVEQILDNWQLILVVIGVIVFIGSFLRPRSSGGSHGSQR